MRNLLTLVEFALFTCATHAAEIDFDTEIVPILSKAGCNAASCHGSAAGQAGFRLSLFGGDADFDYRTIVQELEGRRVNQEQPHESLLFAKATEQLEHGGGEALPSDSASAQTVLAWIEAGTPRLRLRDLAHIKVTPVEMAAEAVPSTFQLNVTAVFNDGTERDVTTGAVYVSQNESALQIDEKGRVIATLPGRHSAIVRFGSRLESVSVTTPIGSGRPATHPVDVRNNWIDDEINSTLALLKLAPGSTASDATFVRRLSLDLTGRLPNPSLVARFVADTGPSKRSALLSELLSSEEFTAYWTHRLAIHLRLRKPAGDEAALRAFYAWLKEQVTNGVGWNTIAAALIMAEGDSHQSGPATVHRLFGAAREEAEYMSEALMGVRLRCANCHNHPLDEWTQDDYHGLAAIFAGLERGEVVRFTGRGEVAHPRTGGAAAARIPGERFLDSEVDPRRSFADWLTQNDNPYFAKAMVGRVWEALMGRGLVTPVDDLRATNPASHPMLFERLTQFFIANDFQLRPLIELICNSAAYGRSSVRLPGSPVDDRFFSHALPKQLAAEVLADAISDVTGAADDYDGTERAVDVVDRTILTAKLEFLGQCPPGEDCSAAKGGGRGIASKLHMINGGLLNEKIGSPDGRLQRLLRDEAPTLEIVQEFYQRALSRPPSPGELSEWHDRMGSSEGTAQRAEHLEDFLWALLNCREFTTNH